MTATGFVWVTTVGRLLVQLRDGQSPDTWQYTSFGVVPVFSVAVLVVTPVSVDKVGGIG